jgi:uncharacterized glyoxalase superfamily protein PhnB
MTDTTRYQIVVKKGRKILDCRYYSSYDAAKKDLDLVFYKFSATGASIEFTDNKTFWSLI